MSPIVRPHAYAGQVQLYVHFADFVGRVSAREDAIDAFKNSAVGAKSPESIDDMGDGLIKMFSMLDRINRIRFRDMARNHSLVAFCTLLDLFLADTAGIVFQRSTDLVDGVWGQRKMNASELRARAGKVVGDVLAENAEEQYSALDIKAKMGLLIKVCPGIDGVGLPRLPQLNGHEKELSSGFPAALYGLYEHRNDIVHRHQLPVASLEQLAVLAAYFCAVMHHIASRVHLAYGVEVETSPLAELIGKSAIGVEGKSP